MKVGQSRTMGSPKKMILYETVGPTVALTALRSFWAALTRSSLYTDKID